MARKVKKDIAKPERDETTVKFDRNLAKLAQHVANDRGISVAEYLSETFREIISRDAAEVGRKLSGS